VSETSVASPTPEAVRSQLQRILKSPVFLTALRLSQFLQFVVIRSIEGQAAAIKEYLIGVEVYNRAPSYDPKADSIVRAEASRLRAKLREYYEADGKNDPVRIDLPKGSYTPIFRLNSSGDVSGPIRPAAPLPRANFRWRWGATAAGLIVVAAIAVIWGPSGGARKVPSIAVMQPANLGQDRTNDTLGDTLADEVTKALVDSAEWKVVGRAPIEDQSGHDQMLTWLQKNLHADLVLTGSYRVGENSNVRLSMQLVNVEDGRLVWTQTYHQRLTLLAESQKEWARALVGDVTEKMRNTSSRKARNPANEQARAYYAQARELWSKYTDQSVEQSLKPFQQATQADPGFAPAWAGLADANLLLVERSLEPVEVRAAELRRAATKAIALDDSNAEAHAALGWMLAFKDWNFQEGSRQLQRAVELDPIRVFPNIFYSQVLTILGNFTDAQASVEAARARLPQIPEVVFQQGSVFFLARKYEKLEALGKELIALDPNGALGHWLVGLSLEQRGQVSSAIAEFRNGLKQEPHDLRTLCALSHTYGLAGANAKALETMRLFIDPDKKEITRYTLSYCAALTYAGIGQKDKAFEWLGKARIGRDASFPFLPWDSRFDPMRSDPRFKPLADSLKKPAVEGVPSS
jgi:TolB-like protein